MELNGIYKVNSALALTLIQVLFFTFTGCGENNHSDSLCATGIGLSHPSPTCSIDEVCLDLVPIYAMFSPTTTYLDTPSDEPVCETSERGLATGRPYYNDGSARSWVDADGVNRYWCEARPPGASTHSTRPLVIWITGSGGSAGGLYDTTSLRDKQQTFNLSRDPERPGFILVSIQPRNLHWPTVDSQDGTKSEIYYRDFYAPSTNTDIAFIDHIIDALVSEGVVDSDRIYLMGWSNGARFSALYSISRHEQMTPGGNHVAAVANYSGGNPYASFDYDRPECALYELPKSSIPFFMISRQCDLVACDGNTDLNIIPGNVAEPWISSLKNDVGADVTWQLIDSAGNLKTSCASAAECTESDALFGHLHWPDGLDDAGGIDHEPTMLQYLAEH
jgi:hypothetical protein